MWVIPLLASVISLFFAMIFTGKWINSKRFSTLLYALSMYLYAIGSFANFFGAAFDWYAWTYKLFYGVGVSLVGYLAAATVYNKFRPLIGHIFLAYVAVITLLLVIAIVPATVDPAILFNSGFSVDNAAMPQDVRQYSFPLSMVGGIVLIVVAIWSWWSSRLVGNLWIAGGAILMTLLGRLATMSFFSWLVPFKELIGIIIIFYGVMLIDKGKLYRPRQLATAGGTLSTSGPKKDPLNKLKELTSKLKNATSKKLKSSNSKVTNPKATKPKVKKKNDKTNSKSTSI